MDEIARTTPTFAGVTFEKLEHGSVQWPCNDDAPEGTPIMHMGGFVRGKGNFVITEYVPTDEKVGPRFPLLLTTGRILSQYNVGAQTRRTENVVWHPEDVLEIHPHDAEERGVRDGDWVRLRSRSGETTLRAHDHRAGGAGRRLYDVPSSRDPGERGHHRLLRLGDQLPGIQGDRGAGLAVQRTERMAGRVSRADAAQPADRGGAGEVMPLVQRPIRAASPRTAYTWRRGERRGQAGVPRETPSPSPITAPPTR